MTAIIFLKSKPENVRTLSCVQIKFHETNNEFFKGIPVHVIIDNHWDDHPFPINDVIKIEIVNS